MAKFHKQIDKPLGQILVERGVINNTQLQQSLEAQKHSGGLIGEIIVELGFTKEEDIAHCFSLQFGYPYLSLENYEISQDIVKLIPKNVCTHYCLIPIDRIGNTLTVAMANPLNIQAIEDLEDITHCDIQIFVSTPSDIRNSIENFSQNKPG
jgi:type IV pilus assembly protein PilB